LNLSEDTIKIQSHFFTKEKFYL